MNRYDFSKMTQIFTEPLMGIKEFIAEWIEFGFRIASGDWLISFTKWYIGAKRIQINYKK